MTPEETKVRLSEIQKWLLEGHLIEARDQCDRLLSRLEGLPQENWVRNGKAHTIFLKGESLIQIGQREAAEELLKKACDEYAFLKTPRGRPNL